MKTTFTKTLLACAVTAACVLSSAAAVATPVYPTFVVNESAFIAGGSTAITANKLVGPYIEVIDFKGATFNASVLYQPTGFTYVDTSGSNSGQSVRSGLNNTYALYALYTASGTVSSTNGITSFNFTPSASDGFNFYLDPGVGSTITSFTQPTTGSQVFGRTNFADDILLATGLPVTGAGSINCVAGNLCGAFTATTSFNLTKDGKAFFVNPTPFYNLSIETGQLNFFTPSGQVVINGSIDTIFNVPEPTSVALLGLGLMGLGMSRRRKQA